MLINKILATALVLTATAASAEPAASPAPTPASAPTESPTKRFCRDMVYTGSMMHRRECRTRAEWEEIDAKNGKSADDFLNARDRNIRPSGF